MTEKKPKYEVVKNYILQSITEKAFLPNGPIPSESELCRTFNVSRIVVRRAIDELVIKNILYRIKGKGTFVSKKPRIENQIQKIKKIAFLLPAVNCSWIEDILFAMEKTLSEKGYLTVVIQTFNDQKLEEKKLYQLRDENFIGFAVITSSVPENQKNLIKYINLNLPIVFVDRQIKSYPFDAVVGDEQEAGLEAVNHLYSSHGLKEIGFFGAEAFPEGCGKERLNSVKEALLKHGFKNEGNRFRSFFNINTKVRKKNSPDDTYAYFAAEEYLKRNQNLEAVIAMNDIYAISLYHACEKLKIKIPEELAVVSYMNDDYAKYLKPPLTSFDQKGRLYGVKVANLLIDRIGGSKEKKRVEKIHFDLICRQSCGCK